MVQQPPPPNPPEETPSPLVATPHSLPPAQAQAQAHRLRTFVWVDYVVLSLW